MTLSPRSLLRAAALGCLSMLLPFCAEAQVDLTTWQGNLQHTGSNLQETQLTPQSVTASGGFACCSRSRSTAKATASRSSSAPPRWVDSPTAHCTT